MWVLVSLARTAFDHWIKWFADAGCICMGLGPKCSNLVEGEKGISLLSGSMTMMCFHDVWLLLDWTALSMTFVIQMCVGSETTISSRTARVIIYIWYAVCTIHTINKIPTGVNYVSETRKKWKGIFMTSCTYVMMTRNLWGGTLVCFISWRYHISYYRNVISSGYKANNSADPLIKK